MQGLVIKNERHCLHNFMEDGNSFQELKMTDQYVNSLSIDIYNYIYYTGRGKVDNLMSNNSLFVN